MREERGDKVINHPKKNSPILGPFFWIGIKGLSLLAEEKKQILEFNISGVILFKRNIQSLPQLFELCQELHSLKSPPLIILDREGGKVDRLSHLPEYFLTPSPEDQAIFFSEKEIEEWSYLQAQDLKDLGIHINFAPLVDVLSVPSLLFKGRTWGKSPKEVSKNSQACFRGIKRAGLNPCAKHFPGHGGVREDSHLELPVDHRSFKDLKKWDLKPFEDMIYEGVEMIMTAHVLYPLVDPHYPASLSPHFLKKVLRKELNFKGLIISDDLDMRALSYSMSQIIEQALLAGTEILLKCKPAEDLAELIEEVEKNLSVSLKKELITKLNKLKSFKNSCYFSPVSSLDHLKKGLQERETHKQKLLKKLSR